MVVVATPEPADSAAAPARLRGGVHRRLAGRHLGRHAAADRHGARAGRRRSALHPLVDLGQPGVGLDGRGHPLPGHHPDPGRAPGARQCDAAARSRRRTRCSTRCWRLPFVALLACGIGRPTHQPPDHADPARRHLRQHLRRRAGRLHRLRPRGAAPPLRAVLPHRDARGGGARRCRGRHPDAARRAADVGPQRVPSRRRSRSRTAGWPGSTPGASPGCGRSRPAPSSWPAS